MSRTLIAAAVLAATLALTGCESPDNPGTVVNKSYRQTIVKGTPMRIHRLYIRKDAGSHRVVSLRVDPANYRSCSVGERWPRCAAVTRTTKAVSKPR